MSASASSQPSYSVSVVEARLLDEPHGSDTLLPSAASRHVHINLYTPPPPPTTLNTRRAVGACGFRAPAAVQTVGVMR